MSPFDEVCSMFVPPLQMLLTLQSCDILEKYLQAIQALNQAHSLDADSPELHIRVVDFKRRCMSPPPKIIWKVSDHAS